MGDDGMMILHKQTDTGTENGAVLATLHSNKIAWECWELHQEWISCSDVFVQESCAHRYELRWLSLHRERVIPVRMNGTFAKECPQCIFLLRLLRPIVTQTYVWHLFCLLLDSMSPVYLCLRHICRLSTIWEAIVAERSPPKSWRSMAWRACIMSMITAVQHTYYSGFLVGKWCNSYVLGGRHCGWSCPRVM